MDFDCTCVWRELLATSPYFLAGNPDARCPVVSRGVTHIHEVSVPTPKSKSGRVTGTWLRNFQIADCSDSEDSDYSEHDQEENEEGDVASFENNKNRFGRKINKPDRYGW